MRLMYVYNVTLATSRLQVSFSYDKTYKRKSPHSLLITFFDNQNNTHTQFPNPSIDQLKDLSIFTMSIYTEEYLKNQLTEKLNAEFVVS